MQLTEGLAFVKLLKLFINSSYFLCLCPFRVSPDKVEKDQHFSAKVSRVQKILCILFTVAGSFWILREVRQGLPNSSKAQDPSMYFHGIRVVVSTAFKLFTIRTFWRKKEVYLKILNLIMASTASSFPTFTSWPCKSVSVFCLCLGYAGIGLMNWITARGVRKAGHISNWSASWWMTGMVEAGRYNFFLFNTQPRNDTDPLSPGEIAIGILASVGFLQRLV